MCLAYAATRAFPRIFGVHKSECPLPHGMRALRIRRRRGPAWWSRSIEQLLCSRPVVPASILSRGQRAASTGATGPSPPNGQETVSGRSCRTVRSAPDSHQRHRARPAQPDAEYADTIGEGLGNVTLGAVRQRRAASEINLQGVAPVNLAAVRDWLGHHDVSTTDRYLATDGVRLRKAAKRLEVQHSPDISHDAPEILGAG